VEAIVQAVQVQAEVAVPLVLLLQEEVVSSSNNLV
jgi:hypothetical protein